MVGWLRRARSAVRFVGRRGGRRSPSRGEGDVDGPADVVELDGSPREPPAVGAVNLNKVGGASPRAVEAAEAAHSTALAHLANCTKTPISPTQRVQLRQSADAALQELQLRTRLLNARAAKEPTLVPHATRLRDRLASAEVRHTEIAAAAERGVAAPVPIGSAEELPDPHADTLKSYVIIGGSPNGSPHGSPYGGSPALSASIPRDPCGSPIVQGSPGWNGSPERSPGTCKVPFAIRSSSPQPGAAGAAGLPPKQTSSWMQYEGSPLAVAALAFTVGNQACESLARAHQQGQSANELSEKVILELRRQHEETMAIHETLDTMRSQLKRARTDLSAFVLTQMRDKVVVACAVFTLICAILVIVLKSVNPMGVTGVPGPDAPAPLPPTVPFIIYTGTANDVPAPATIGT